MTRKAAALCVLLAAACGHLDEVDVTRSGTVTVPGGPPDTPIVAGTVAVPLVIGRQALADEGIDPSDVDSARLVALRVEVLAGTSLEAWLDRIAFHVEAPGLPRVLVAEKRDIGALPAGTRAIQLTTPGVDLKPYLLASSTTVTADVEGTQPSEDTTLRAAATIRVDVNVSGLFD
jgi:hypothetical protein